MRLFAGHRVYEEGTGDNLCSVSVAADRTGSFPFFSFSASSSRRGSALRAARGFSVQRAKNASRSPRPVSPRAIAIVVTHEGKKTFNRSPTRTRRDSSQTWRKMKGEGVRTDLSFHRPTLVGISEFSSLYRRTGNEHAL